MTSQTDRRNGITGNLGIKAPVCCTTTANITLSGLQTIDGITVVADDRVLVKNQTDTTQNGVYNASSSTWQRALDFDGVNDVVSGTLVGITNGTTQANQIWQLVATNPITFDTTALTFVYILTTNSSTNLSTLAALASVANLSTLANLSSVANLSTLANLSSVANLSTAAVGKGADIASASTVNLTTATGEYVNITGTTTITAITLTSGSQRLVRFTGILTLTNGASLVLPSAADITTAAGDFALFVGDASSVVRCVGYFGASLLATESVAGIAKLPKQITIANNVSDANNDINFSAGNFQFSDWTGIATLSALTKRLDATWAAGTNQGGLFSGSKANSTWYHCFAIYNPTSGVVDCGFDTSVSAANIPSGYTKYKRVGSIRTNGSGNIFAFTQAGKDFIFKSIIVDKAIGTQPLTPTLLTLTTPLGIVVEALLTVITEYVTSSSNCFSLFIDPANPNTTPSNTNFTQKCLVVVDERNGMTSQIKVLTNTSSQIMTNTVGTTYQTGVFTNGWTDYQL